MNKIDNTLWFKTRVTVLINSCFLFFLSLMVCFSFFFLLSKSKEIYLFNFSEIIVDKSKFKIFFF